MGRISQKNKKLVVGLTGGVGSGKSSVSRLMQEEYGALILEADRICNALIEPEGSEYRNIVDLLGPEILTPSGEIDRKKMAALIFSDPKKRLAVNQILHPATFRAVQKRIASSRKKLIVYESAIPLEARFSELCHKVIYVYASPKVRKERLKASRDYSEEKSEAIMRSQPDEAFYYSLADSVVNNEGDRESCRRDLKRILQSWGLEEKA